jgi:hypothetical protein
LTTRSLAVQLQAATIHRKEANMAGIFKDPLLLLFGKGKKWYSFHAWVALALDCLGTACLAVGIIAAALDRELGLEPTHWLLLAIALWVGGLWSWLLARDIGKKG